MERRCPPLDQVAERAVTSERVAPTASVASAYRHGDTWCVDYGGYQSVEPRSDPENLVFDLASVTKPLTALTLARLVRADWVAWSTPLGVLVREALSTPSEQTALELLAAHRAGLDRHRPLYAPLESGGRVNRFHALQEAALARRNECLGSAPESGFPSVYSDLGFLLLGEALARVTSLPLDRLVQREVCDRIGSHAASARQWLDRDPSFTQRVVPTEIVAWRGGEVKGVVHDENAWALGGSGMCGHAGLFGTALDVVAIGVALLDVLSGRRSDWLTAHDIEPLIRLREGTTLRAGFDSKSDNGSSAGSRCSSATFGHLGFTGTALWIDPTTEITVAFLTNRVHPTRANETIKSVRPIVHDALFQWAEEQRGRPPKK